MDFQEWLVVRSDSSQHAGQLARTLELARHLELPRGARVLDLGCGSAKSSVELARRFGVRVTGLDRAPGSLARAAVRLARTGRPSAVSLVRGDGLTLPFVSGAFEAVLVEAVAYAAPLGDLLAEVRRVLVPGGRLGMIDLARRPDGEPAAERFRAALGERTFNLFTVAEWRAAVEGAGLEGVRAEGFPIAVDRALVRAELGDWLRSLPRQAWMLASSPVARRHFVANYRVGFDRSLEGCLVVASRPRATPSHATL